MRPTFPFLLLGCLLSSYLICSVQAQQVMPRLLRQFTERPGLNLKAGHMGQDAQGRLWLASHDGVACFDGRQFRVYHDPVVKKGDYYYIVIPTADGRVWPKMGRGHTLAYIDPGRQRMVRLSDSTRLVRDYLAKYGCHYILPDAQGNLWIGLKKKGLLRFNPRTLAVDHLVDRPLDVRGIAQDRRGVIYFTTIEQGLFAYTPRTGALTNYQHNRQDTTTLGSNATYGVATRPDGSILIGLVNEVDILTPATGRIQRVRLNAVRSTNPILEDYIYDFHQDTYGNAYFSTGIATFRYTQRGVLQRIVFGSPTDFIEGLYVSPSNRLWISAAHTLSEYDLNQVREVPPLIFLSVLVNGTQLEGNTATRRLTYDTLGHPTLTVQENDLFSLRFALLADRRSLTIRHLLQDYDREWAVDENFEGLASYQLPGGTYTFAVNRGHRAGGWDPTMYTLTVVVVPPFWKTGYALTLALLLVSGLGYYLTRTYLRRRQLRQQLLLEQREAATLREMDALKSGFFANVTHEFRTPLTIILNATENLAATSPTPGQQTQVATIQRHAHQLLRLITETLDMARLDAGKLEPAIQVGDPMAFMRQVVNQFGGLARQGGIDLIWTTNERSDGLTVTASDERLYRFDADKWEKIAYNLLANALKFTPKGGQVHVTGHIRADDRFVLRVADTGIGIAADQLPRIFERFHQVDASSTRAYSGTGIGLALVKELTDWLGGRVAVESEVGRGSVFTVELPLAAPAPENPGVRQPTKPLLHPAVEISARSRSGLSAGIESGAMAVSDSEANSLGNPIVLVVEDNADLRAQIANYLSAQYQMLTASTGRQGLESALAEVPDLIVSDVMMPEMDGYELVERLKADERTSHIPVILLTAKSSPDSRMKGLQAGADEYVGKPFSLAELALRIGNGLRTRQNWQKRFIAQPILATTAAPNEPGLEREERFLNRLRQAILDHIELETLDVDWLAAHARMSRTQLHRKLTALTSLSPNRFIHRVRLERAADLLRMGELNVAQVAYQVGYSSQSYFAKVFQEHFGHAPAKLKG